MKVSGKISYKSAIIVNDTFFQDIDELLMKYFEKPKYSAQLVNGDEIEFESLSELISYDNFSERAIKAAKIDFGIGNYIRIEPSISLINAYSSTLEMKFEADSNDTSEEVKRKFKLICNKHKQSLLYTAASKFALMHISILMIGISFILSLFILISHNTTDNAMSSSTKLAIYTVGVVIGLLTSFILTWIIKQLFPAIVFLLGENIDKVEKKSKLKSNVFWGIIVTGILTVVLSKFF